MSGVEESRAAARLSREQGDVRLSVTLSRIHHFLRTTLPSQQLAPACDQERLQLIRELEDWVSSPSGVIDSCGSEGSRTTTSDNGVLPPHSSNGLLASSINIVYSTGRVNGQVTNDTDQVDKREDDKAVDEDHDYMDEATDIDESYEVEKEEMLRNETIGKGENGHGELGAKGKSSGEQEENVSRNARSLRRSVKFNLDVLSGVESDDDGGDDKVYDNEDDEDYHANKPVKGYSRRTVKVKTAKKRGHDILGEVKSNKCWSCDSVLETKFLLTSHIRQHIKLGTLRCESCGMAFSDTKSYYMHVKSVHEENKFSCSICGKSFTEKGNLKQHMAVHDAASNEEKPHDCDQCPQMLPTQEDLAGHTAHHTEGKAFKCDNCEESFHRKSHLTLHRRRKHEQKVGKVTLKAKDKALKKEYSCTVCFKVYTDQRWANQCQLRHKGLHKTFQCSVCGKSFSSNKSLKDHRKQQHEDNPYKCAVCGENFGEMIEFDAHLLLHMPQLNPAARYRCDQCDFMFDTNHHLREHNRRMKHLNFPCNLCELKFVSPYELANHKRRIHDKSRDFPCEQCEIVCFNSFELKRHVMRSHMYIANATTESSSLLPHTSGPIEGGESMTNPVVYTTV